MQIHVKKLNDNARLPVFAHIGDAGADLFAAEEIMIQPGERAAVSTGVALVLPQGYVSLIWPKSGLAAHDGIMIMAGVVDAEYRGEYKIIAYNSGTEPKTFAVGDKVAQLLVQQVAHPDFIEVVELDETTRGEGGFGSTGK